ncbi:MAG: azurin [Gemmatimonadetes bacterium]|nr:azurin [Gemmatimonadota bacterium]MBT6146369.1 azurin [Gemmatimonadota bacterium]MBT7860986.1 azurin [Gemmatimonadota bacterium]
MPIVSLAVAVLLLVGCGGNDQGGNSVRVTIAGSDQMKFDRATIEVPAGARVILTLEHRGRMSVGAMGHNFVLLQQGVDLDGFARAAARAGTTDHIPPRKQDQVIAHTRMLGGGETDTITFEAPAPGTYKFICSFPGHYLAMRGDFVVR